MTSQSVKFPPIGRPVTWACWIRQGRAAGQYDLPGVTTATDARRAAEEAAAELGGVAIIVEWDDVEARETGWLPPIGGYKD